MRLLTSSISLLLIPLLTVLPVSAKINDSNLDAPGSKASTLQIRLLDSGLGSVRVNSTSPSGYTIQVADGAGQPMADVAVAVRLPDEGPSGWFADGSRASVAYTDATGQVKVPPVRWAALAGTAEIRITAAKGGIRAGALIQQVITPIADAAKPAATPAAEPTKPTQPITTAAAQPVPGTVKPTVAAPIPAARSGAATAPIPPVAQTAASPSVSITSTAASQGGSTVHRGGSKKWIIFALVAAGAGVGVALALGGHGAASTSTPSTLTIGAPSLSVGH